MSIRVLMICPLIMPGYDYQNSIGFIIRSTAKAFEGAFDQQLRNRVGITVTQSRVIGTLAIIKDGMTQKEIADKIGIEAPTIVPIIDRLEEQKMVIRKPDPNDRRNNLIFLTSKSEAKWQLIIECALELEKASCPGLSEQEIDITKSTLRKITLNVSGLYPKSSTSEFTKSKGENNILHVRRQHASQHGKQKLI
ncbi:MAG: MarR family transcriptional regulator [Thermoproteota archaeon]|nr:MarR family transcriptional regulator [Thermoproteota archaeon]